MHNSLSIRTLSVLALAATAVAAAGGCHHEFMAKETDSATEAKDLFGESETDTADSGIPTTSESDSGIPTTSVSDTDQPVNPQETCELHPTPAFPGVRFECGGSFTTTLVFDFYGASDVPLDKLLPCQDLSKESPKQAGYRYTCFAVLKDQEFGAGAERANLRNVEACCIETAPDEAVDPFCRIDAAQDMCVATSDYMNELRKQIPFIPKFKEINDQLENLNEFIASSVGQSDCAKTLAKGFIATGDIETFDETVDWQPTAKVQLDPQDGWPWFRALDLNVNEFALEDKSETDSACLVPALEKPLVGTFAGGKVGVSDGENRTEALLTRGAFSFSKERCNGQSCAFQLETLQLTVTSFSLAGYRFDQISAEMTAPARGTISGESVRIPGQQIELSIHARVSSTDVPSNGELRTLQLRTSGDMVASLSQDSRFAVESLRLANWPVEIELTTTAAAAR